MDSNSLDPKFSDDPGKGFGEFMLLKIVIAVRIFQMIYIKDLRDDARNVTNVSNFVWLVLIMTYTGVGVSMLTIHGGFWICRTILYMDTFMFILQFLMYNVYNAYD